MIPLYTGGPEVEKVVTIYSGGMDSTVLLYHLRHHGYDVRALTVDYGQRHRRELYSAQAICLAAGIPHQVADLTGITHLLKVSSLTGCVDVPDGHYAEESMKATIVPNRNMIMLSVAIGHAISLGARLVAYGAHAGDHAIYPDCRPEFAQAMSSAALLADWHPVDLLRPFITLTKAEIAKVGSDLAVPFELTWSCYRGGERHCGRCGTCVERSEAFSLAGLPDPTLWAD